MIAKYEGVTLCQETHTVLSDISFEIPEGDWIYVMGEVGSGKTSLLRSLYGELPIAEGKAEIFGMNLSRMKVRNLPVLRKQLGIVFQDFQLLSDRTVDENLDFVLRATGWKRKEERERRIIEVLEMVGLPEKTRHMPYELSGGEQQRVSIARAFLNYPKLLIADEPTANLDEENGRRILELLREIQQTGTTIIMSTHNTHWIDHFPGQRWICREGRLDTEAHPISSEFI
ncbi:MAG: ATP-binding cassette domain-containing protein [Bacteroidaceae bacterium]|nr:ATP-binding cassette domain-containing protein [Bacteroidaceae bacterium]